MTEESKLVLVVTTIFLGVCIFSFHAIAVFYDKRAFTYINIALHPILFGILFFLECDMGVLLASLMASVCVYSVFRYVSFIRRKTDDV